MTVARLLELTAPWLLVGAGVAAARLWWSYRTLPAAWVAVTFASLDLIIVQRFFGTERPVIVTRLLVSVLLAFPYLLLRFADSLVPIGNRWRRAATALFVLAIGATFVPGVLAEQGAARDGFQTAYTIVALTEWACLTIGAGAILFRGRRGQSRVVRSRQTMLAIGAWSIGFALVVSALGPSDPAARSELSVLLSQVLAVASGLTFLIGFAPPRFLLAAWRHRDEQALYDAAVGFVRAESPHDVTAVLLPALADLLGVRGVALLDADGVVVGHSGRAIEPHGGRTRRFAAGEHTVIAEASPTTPLFTREQEEVIDRLGLLGELALERTRLLMSERQARADIEALNAELEAFVYTTSHDLKNPIIAILGYLELIEDDHRDELSERVVHYLERITANADYMQALIHDLLELSRVGRIDVQPIAVDLTSLIEDLTVEVRRQAPRATIRHGELPVLWMNPVRAQQLFSNLLDNAVRYSGRDDVTIEVTAQRDHLGVLIDIVDDGVGIPASDLNRVFGLFERLDPDASDGTGVGLAICRRIAETNGGSISALDDGDGAHIRLRLPRAALSPAGERGGMIPLELRPRVRPAGVVDRPERGSGDGVVARSSRSVAP